jgi:hypothetical protein
MVAISGDTRVVRGARNFEPCASPLNAVVIIGAGVIVVTLAFIRHMLAPLTLLAVIDSAGVQIVAVCLPKRIAHPIRATPVRCCARVAIITDKSLIGDELGLASLWNAKQALVFWTWLQRKIALRIYQAESRNDLGYAFPCI